MSSRTVLDLEIWLLQASRYDVQQGLSRDIRCRLWNKRAKPGTHLTVVLLNSEHRIVFLVDTTATPQVDHIPTSAARVLCLYQQHAESFMYPAVNEPRFVLRLVILQSECKLACQYKMRCESGPNVGKA